MSRSRTLTGYRLVLPPPWTRISLAGDVRAQARAFVDRAAQRAPGSLSPDELAPIRAQMTHRLESRWTAARDGGGVDFYLPAEDLRGVHLGASFLVSTVLPGASLDGGLAPQVLSELVADGATRVNIAGHDWARTDEVVDTDSEEMTADDVRARRVDYTAPVPGDGQLWVLVSFTTLGDGDPTGQVTAAVVDLFDAMMSTWRWTAAP